MIHAIEFGVYHFRKQRIACRMDYCNYCEKEVLTECIRSFDCGHCCYIPLIPLGFHDHWVCTQCQSNPRKLQHLGRPFKVFALIVLALFCTMLWRVPGVDTSGAALVVWALRILMPIALVASIYLVYFRPSADPSNTEQRRHVTPLGADSCVYCHRPLQHSPELRCPACNVRVYTELK